MTHLNPDNVTEWLRALWPRRSASVIAGVDDDDCAVFSVGDQLMVATLDFVNASPICIELGIGSLYDVGFLLVGMNASDLCGSGVSPAFMLLGVTMKHGTEESDFRALASGVDAAARLWGIEILGGDTKLGPANAFTATAFGFAKSLDQIFLRNRARPGDSIWISGEVGSCACAVAALTNDEFPKDAQFRHWTHEAILRPTLPLDVSRHLSSLALSCSGTDVSDGIGADLFSLCKSSSLGAELDARLIPTAQAVETFAQHLGVPPWSFAFASGGDLQFLATAPAKFDSRIGALGLHRIGEIKPNTHGLKLRLSDTETVSMPIVGHSDAHRMSFPEEIGGLVREVANTCVLSHD